MSIPDIPVKCTRCRFACMESTWLDKLKKTSGSISMTEKVCPKCGCKSYYDMHPQVAWCWASGLIEIGDAVPAGGIKIAECPKSELRAVIEGVARHGKGGACLNRLVPGIPEAESEEAEADALEAWLDWCAKGNGKKHRKGVVFMKGQKGVPA